MDNKAATQYLQSIVRDTPIELLQIQQEIWEGKTDEERLHLTFEHIDASRAIFENNIRIQNPGWSEEKIRTVLFTELYSSFYSESEIDQITNSIANYHRNK